jgi:AcrR family transcriptional regulator
VPALPRHRAATPARRAPAAGLAERLLDEAWDLAASEGLEALTLRRIARRAGVTHGAPLRHFPGLAALLSEVAARGFRMLFEQVEAAQAAQPPGAGPRARLAAAGRAYVRCAVANPGVFELMFRPERVDGAHPRLARDSKAAFEQLVRAVRAAQDAGFAAARDTRRVAGSVWAAVHGLALLWVQGAYGAAVPGTRLEDAITTTLELLLGDARSGRKS